MQYDVFISGAGIAGLATAAAFGHAGFSVLCVDPVPPVKERSAQGADLRTTAILAPGQRLFDKIGVWDRLQDQASTLKTMRIVNIAPQGKPLAPKDFIASDIDQDAFGWNIPNWFLRRELLAHLEEQPNVTFEPGVGTETYSARSDLALVKLSDGRKVASRLLIAADGRDSPMRKCAKIPTRTLRYGQKALVFAVTHDAPHLNVSTEVHKTGGPFTLVPLPDFEGRPCSAVVWMDDGPAQVARQELPEPDFNRLITERSGQVMGALTCVSPRSLWPIISQHAERLVASRLALVAEAAHVVPPIGAQGLNMSLKDCETLIQLAQTHRETLGSVAMLAAYERARLPDIRMRVAGIDMLNRASQLKSPALQAARGVALDALHRIAPIRTSLMKLGLGGSNLS